MSNSSYIVNPSFYLSVCEGNNTTNQNSNFSSPQSIGHCSTIRTSRQLDKFRQDIFIAKMTF